MLNKNSPFTHRNILGVAIECELSCAHLGQRFLAQIQPAQLESFRAHSYRLLAGLQSGRTMVAAIEMPIGLERHRPHAEKLQGVPIADN